VKGAFEGSQIYREWGYEIRKHGAETLLIDRRLWPVAYPLAIFTALAVLLVCVGLTLLVETLSSGRSLTTWAIPFGVGIALLFVLIPLWKTYRHRRDLPAQEIADTLIIDSTAGVLRRGDGRALSQLDAVRAVRRRDWWFTRGLMQLVILAWPGGRRVVFRTASGRKAREVLEILQAHSRPEKQIEPAQG